MRKNHTYNAAGGTTALKTSSLALQCNQVYNSIKKKILSSSNYIYCLLSGLVLNYERNTNMSPPFFEKEDRKEIMKIPENLQN